MYTGLSNYSLNTNMNYTEGFIHAFVLQSAEDLGEGNLVGFYIPKIMGYQIDISKGASEESININSKCLINDDKCKVNLPNNVTSVNYIKANPLGFTNMKPPMIAKGETCYIVFIDGDFKHPRYLYNNTNEKKRAVDHLEFFVTSKDDGDGDIEDAYKIVASGRDQKIHIHVSNKNGEDSTYDFILDGKNGKATLTDEDGNEIGIEKKGSKVWMINKEESEFMINGRDIGAICKGKFTIQCLEYEVKADNSVSIEAGVDMKLKSTTYSNEAVAKIDNKAPMIKESVDALYENTSPMSTFGGIVAAPGLMVSKGPNSAPSGVGIDSGGGTFSNSPIGVAAYGDKIIPVLTLLASMTIMPAVSIQGTSPMLPLIPSINVKM